MYTRADLAAAARREYRKPSGRLSHPRLRHMRACAHNARARGWMLAYQHRLWKAWAPVRQRAAWWADCANTPTWRVIACIRYAAWRWAVDVGTMLRISACESGHRPWARNPSGASGLYQFMPGTFRTAGPYGGKSIWNARWSALAAAWYMRHHGTSAWVCRG